MNRPVSPPEEFDFAVLTINAAETEAVTATLGLNQDVERGGKIYKWNYVENSRSELISVVSADTNDRKGDAEMKNLASRVLDHLHPENFLVLGIAGGIKERKVKLGQVAISKYIRYSTVKHETDGVSFEEIPVLPPDEHLFSLAITVANERTWPQKIGIARPSKSESGRLALPLAEAEEFISGPNLLGDPNSKLLHGLKNQFQRARFVEMETGGLAHECLKWARNGKYVPYLAIKGISDFVDHEQNPGQRKKWREYAARSSAAFCLSLLRKWKRNSARPLPLELCLPDGIQILRNQDCIGVLHMVDESRFSKILAHSVSRIMAGTPRVASDPSIFTVCIYDPSRIWSVVETEAKRIPGPKPALGSVDYMEHMKKCSELSFPHFGLFNDWTASIKTGRLLILSGAEQHEERHWELFRFLNGNVPCWVIDRDTLIKRLGVQWISGHATVRGYMMFDFFGDSETLLITDVRSSQVLTLSVLEKKFWETTSMTNPKPFVPLQDYLKRHRVAGASVMRRARIHSRSQ